MLTSLKQCVLFIAISTAHLTGGSPSLIGQDSSAAIQEEEIANDDLSIDCSNKRKTAKPGYCNIYYDCQKGIREEKVCPEGLVFNPKTNDAEFPCHYSNLVKCEGQIQSIKPTNQTGCEREWGLAKDHTGDCGDFINCVGGRALRMRCPKHLAFNEHTYQCDYPDLVPSCNAEEYLGFSCPSTYFDEYKNNQYRRFKSPNCREYFICIANKPRVGYCTDGQVFDEESSACRRDDGISCTSNQFRSVYASKASRMPHSTIFCYYSWILSLKLNVLVYLIRHL